MSDIGLISFNLSQQPYEVGAVIPQSPPFKKMRIRVQRSEVTCLKSHDLVIVGTKREIQDYSPAKPYHLNTITHCSILLKKLCVNANLR